MGNNKFFKLSDMIPNAWFHKLKHNMTQITKSKKPNTNTKTKNKNDIKNNLTPISTTTTTKTTSPPKLDPPRKSSKRRSVSSSSSSRRRRPAFTSVVINNSSESENDASSFLRLSSSTADIIIDLKSYHPPSPMLKPATTHTNENKNDVVSDYDGVDLVDLPPILTKPINFDDKVFEAATKSYNRSRVRAGHGQKPSISAGIRLRSANSPRVAAGRRRSVSYRRERKCLTESFAVVKASVDPQRDFRESMVEMIVENNIRASKDLEELLACFLSLNSKEYHDVIVNAFEQIWFDMSDIRIM